MAVIRETTAKMLLFLSFLFISTIECQFSAGQGIEQSLVKKLFTNYSRNIRPSDQVIIEVNLQLKQIISLVEKTQILTTSVYIEQWWTDNRLSWVPSNYNNINSLQLSLKKIWEPDTCIVNSVTGDGYLAINSDFGYASVLYTGEVYYVSPVIALQTRCSLNVSGFPFDSQKCPIKITSWSFTDAYISYDENNSYVSLDSYLNNSIWYLSSTTVDKKLFLGVDSGFNTGNNTMIELNLYIQRTGLFYMINSVFPGFILNIVTVLAFFMPFANGLNLST